jgi:hypothetical protein
MSWKLVPSLRSAERKPSVRVDLAELDTTLIAAYLDHLERQRGNRRVPGAHVSDHADPAAASTPTNRGFAPEVRITRTSA